MKTETLIRSQIPLNEKLKVEVLHNIDLSENRFRICQRIESSKRENGQSFNEGEWFVRAEFAYVNEFTEYLHYLEITPDL